MRVAPREMMRMHVEALFTRDAAGDLACINEPAGGGGPARKGLALPPAPAPYEDIIGRLGATKTWAGPAFTFPERLPAAAGGVVEVSSAPVLEPLLSAWIPDLMTCQPMVALILDGKAVSICASVRITGDAHEAGVDTAPAYRGRGYAAQVATAWASAVRDIGRIPFYSTSWTNTASRSVARKLSLIHFGNDLHVPESREVAA